MVVGTVETQLQGVAVFGVPGLTVSASRPRELTLKSDPHVEESPSAYDGVVELAEGDDDDDGVAEPTEDGRQPAVDFGHTHLSVLPQRLLEKKASDADGKQHDKVGDEESACRQKNIFEV